MGDGLAVQDPITGSIKIRNESPIGANISDGFRVYKSMQDEAKALVTGPPG